MSNYTDGITFRTNTSIPSGGNGYDGGSERDESATPFTKGYFFVFFALPGTLFNSTMSANDAKQYLLNSAIDFQPHADRQLQTVEVKGIGNTTANFIVGQQTTQDFSLTFKEYATSPICKIHKKWTSYINPFLGGSTVADVFAPSEYNGSVMVIQTKPVARVNKDDWKLTDIIKVDLYDGVFPLPDPSSPFNNGVEQMEKVSIPVQYKFDGQPLTEVDADTLNQALEVLQNADIYKMTNEIYTKLSVSGKILSGINT